MSSRPSERRATRPDRRRVAEFVSAHIGSPPREVERERIRSATRELPSGPTKEERVTVGVMVAYARRCRAGRAPIPRRGADRRGPELPGGQSQIRPPGGYLLVSQTADSLLAFSDGSKVRMAARTRGRVVDLNNAGPRSLSTTGRSRSISFIVLARSGPSKPVRSASTCTGRRSPSPGTPPRPCSSCALPRGAVSVTSPVAGPEIRMRAGQTLRVSLRDQSSAIGTTSSREVPSAPERPPRSSSLEPSRIAPPELSEPARWSHRGWMMALSENGGRLVADADRRGLTAVLERADSDDLWALANAARYAGRVSARAPGSERAEKAFPVVGSGAGSGFLARAPARRRSRRPGERARLVRSLPGRGPLWRACLGALGRKMTLFERWDRRTEALAVARDYLRRFPRGTYANAARALVRSSTAAQ